MAALTLLAALAAGLAAQPGPSAPEALAPASRPSLERVFGEVRPADSDLLIMRSQSDGSESERLVGDLLETEVALQAPYGRIALPVERVAGIAMGDPTDPERLFETLVTVANDQFSGILLSPSFRFRLRGGDEITVRRELIERVVVRRRPLETRPMPLRQQFVLHSGDHFSGGLSLTDPISLSTAYGPLTFALEQIGSITWDAPGGPARVALLDGGVRTGALTPARLPIELDCTVDLPAGAMQIALYTGRMQTVLCQPGVVDPSLLPSGEPELLLPDAVFLPTDGSSRGGDLDQTQIDAYAFRAAAGTSYTITTANISGADTVMELLDADAETQIAVNDDGGVSMGSQIVWTCAEDGTYHLRVWQYGGGPSFLSQFPDGQVPPGYAGGFPQGRYEIWIDAQPGS